MCYVTITELRNKLGYYLEKSSTEDVFVTKNGKVISVLMNPHKKIIEELKGCLEGAIPDDVNYKDYIGEKALEK